MFVISFISFPQMVVTLNKISIFMVSLKCIWTDNSIAKTLFCNFWYLILKESRCYSVGTTRITNPIIRNVITTNRAQYASILTLGPQYSTMKFTSLQYSLGMVRHALDIFVASAGVVRDSNVRLAICLRHLLRIFRAITKNTRQPWVGQDILHFQRPLNVHPED